MAQHDVKRQALELALEKAHYDVHQARRQYDRVDPDNRLVAREFERRWHDARQRVVEVEAQLTTLTPHQVILSDDQRQHLLRLGQDLETVWHHEAAPVDLKKRILRTVLYEIIMAHTAEPPEYLLHLHWQGGVHPELRVARTKPGKHRRATAPQVLDLLQEFSKICSDATTAATLNRLGYRTGTGKTWRAHSVASVRYQYRLPNFAKGKDWLTLKRAAEQLNVSETVVNRLIAQGTLPASQAVPLAPWVIRRADLDLDAVQCDVQAVRAKGLRSKRERVSVRAALETSDVTSKEDTPSSIGSNAQPCA